MDSLNYFLAQGLFHIGANAAASMIQTSLILAGILLLYSLGLDSDYSFVHPQDGFGRSEQLSSWFDDSIPGKNLFGPNRFCSQYF